MRTFLAFEVEERVHDRVAQMTGQLKNIDRNVRWVRPKNAHVTIHFFGEVEQVDVPEIESIIEKAIEHISPFDVEVRGISAFPSLERASVIWYGIVMHENLLAVYNTVRDGLLGKDLVEKLETRVYTPHLTAGRVRRRINSQLLQELRIHGREYFGTFTVDSLVLFKSTLSGSGRGPVYEKLSIFKLRD
jgi:2'-5' RNA ligase